jgi:hypothetical protein
MPLPSTSLQAAVIAALSLTTIACGGGGGGGAGGHATTTATGTTTGTGSMTGSGTTTSTGSTSTTGCTDPLHTGLVAMQTGISVDAYDCEILAAAAKYGEPDPMIFKAIIYVESRFDNKAVACSNDPCGVPSGWTAAESGCYGLMQYVLACVTPPSGEGFLSNGHPDLDTDPTQPTWASSIFNPAINVDLGVAGVANNRKQVQQQFPGCTVDQYTLMAVGNYNSYGSTTSCTQYNTAYDDLVLMAYQQYASAAGYAAHSYP